MNHKNLRHLPGPPVRFYHPSKMNFLKVTFVALALLAGPRLASAQYTAMNTGVAQKNAALIQKNNALPVASANGKTAVAFFNALLNARDVAFLKTIIAPDIAFRNSLGVTVNGIDGLTGMMTKMDGNFAGFRIEITEVIAEGDAVFLKANFSGTHSSAFLAPAATNKPFTVPGFASFVIKNGKVLSGFSVADFYQITKQI